MHTLTIGLGQQTAVHLQFQTREGAKAAYDCLHQARDDFDDLVSITDDYEQEVDLDAKAITHVLLQDMRKSLEAAIEMHKIQTQAQRMMQGGLAAAGSILPFGRSQ